MGASIDSLVKEELSRSVKKGAGLEDIPSVKMDEQKSEEDTRLTKALDASRTSRIKSKVETATLGKPRLTKEALRASQTNYLPTPKKKDPNYKYTWLSTDHNAKPHFWDAQENLGFFPCSVNDYPDMIPHVYQTKVDLNISSDKVVYKEMILCKLHVDDWQLLMTEYHHDRPAEAARDIYRNHTNRLKAFGGSVRDVSRQLLEQETYEPDSGTAGVTLNSQGRFVQTRAPKFNLSKE
jgi:hypothetical protein